MQKRNILLDVAKGIAIIAVILYHSGALSFGFLGVEIFLVIGGYLTTKSLLHVFEDTDEKKSFDIYKDFIANRLARLWPMLVIITIISFILGWLWMLPIPFKMTCEMTVASNLFLNNIVQYITSGDYWSIKNDYYPLMHTWYIGILFQFYLIFPLLFILIHKFSKHFHETLALSVWGLFFVSLLLFSLPILDEAENFYLLPSRFYEFCTGALIALYPNSFNKQKIKIFVPICLSLLFLLLTLNADTQASKLWVLSTVLLAAIITFISHKSYTLPIDLGVKTLALLGTASYSLYLCHQVILAFYRHTITTSFTIHTHLLLLVISILTGLILYFIIERSINAFLKKDKKRVLLINGSCAILIVLLAIPSIFYYAQGGMVRDVPELDMYIGKPYETPAAYNGSIFSYDKDFTNNDKKNILVIGDSYARDFINILIESGVDKVMNISYHVEMDSTFRSRLQKADYIFAASSLELKTKYPDLLPLILNKNFYRVGCKSFTSGRLGIVYNNNRYGPEYYNQKAKEGTYTRWLNDYEKSLFGDHFIDLMDEIKDENGEVPVFYNEQCISQDGSHLTRAGVKMFADKLNIWRYLN